MRALVSWGEAPGSQRHQTTMYNEISEVLSWDIERVVGLLLLLPMWTGLD